MSRAGRTGLTLAAILAAGAGGYWEGQREIALPTPLHAADLQFQAFAEFDGSQQLLTLTPGTRLPKASRTIATRGPPNAVPTVVLWLKPEVAEMLAGAPAVFVRLNEAEPFTPSAAAVTL